jgi:transcriptional regulator with XRE-family HTH domain
MSCSAGSGMAPISRDKLYAQIGSRIRKVREAQEPRVTQTELAKRLEIERTSITNIENGSQRATVLLLYRIAEQLGISLELLLPVLNDSSIHDGLAEIKVGGRTQTVPTAVKNVFDKV